MSLVAANEPLVLADGTKIDPETGEIITEQSTGLVEVPSASEAVRLVTKARKRIADLPDIPQRTHVLGAVLTYHLFGLDDTEIALATGMTVDQVGNLQMTDAFMALRDTVITSILQSEAENVRNLFSQGARDAAKNITSLAKAPNALGFRAAKDVLDRAGMRPADVVEHRHSLEGGLQIVHIRRGENETVPNVQGLSDVLKH